MSTVTRLEIPSVRESFDLEGASVFSGGRRGFKPPSQYVCAAGLLAADLAAFGVSFCGARACAWLAGAVFWPHAAPAIEPAGPAASLAGFAALLAGVVVHLAARGHYVGRVPFWDELRHLLGACSVALLCAGFVELSLHAPPSRLPLLGTWAALPFAAVACRRLTRRLLARLKLWRLRVVVVGRGEAARRAVAALLSEPGLGYDVAGVVAPDAPDAARPTRHPPRHWEHVLRGFGARLLVLAPDAGAPADSGVVEALVRRRVPFAVVPAPDGAPALGCERTAFFGHDAVLLSYRDNLARPAARLAKLAFDLLAAAVMLAVLAPVMLAVAASVKLDGGPVLFAHPRLGAGGRAFNCLKFRTMVVDADAALQRLLAADPAAAREWASTRKLRHDPRVTRVGAVLRALSLDELPQLFNVLRLEMSLVGPRPIPRQEAALYGEEIEYYYETRPGLTGLWQVSGRSDTSYAQRVRLDTWYVKNWTVWHDLAILAKTVPAVLKRRGAV